MRIPVKMTKEVYDTLLKDNEATKTLLATAGTPVEESEGARNQRLVQEAVTKATPAAFRRR